MVTSSIKVASLHRGPDGGTAGCTVLETSIRGVKVDIPGTTIVTVGVEFSNTSVSALGGSEGVGVISGGKMNGVKVTVAVVVMMCVEGLEPQALDASAKISR